LRVFTLQAKMVSLQTDGMDCDLYYAERSRLLYIGAPSSVVEVRRKGRIQSWHFSQRAIGRASGESFIIGVLLSALAWQVYLSLFILCSVASSALSFFRACVNARWGGRRGTLDRSAGRQLHALCFHL
jgi:hypothetical protein